MHPDVLNVSYRFERYPEDESFRLYGQPGLDLYGHLFEDFDFTATAAT